MGQTTGFLKMAAMAMKEEGDLRERAEECFRKRRGDPGNGADDGLPHESFAMAS